MAARKDKPASPAASTASEESSFETSLARLEEIVDELEGGEIPLERAIALFEEGVGLGRRCSARLEDAERKITLLLEQVDGSTKEVALQEGSAPPASPAGGTRKKVPLPPTPSGPKDDENRCLYTGIAAS